MSIIYDALQKTQSNRNPIPEKPIFSQKKSFNMKKITIMMIAVIIATFGFFYFKLFFAKQPIALKNNPGTELAEINKIIVNGVFISPELKTTLINNRYLTIGDHINGMKIIGIDYQGVRLSKNNRIITIKPKI